MSGQPDFKPNRRYGPKPERRRFDFEEAKRRYLDGETTTEIARSFGVSNTAVGAALKRMGIELRRDAWKANLQIANEAQKQSPTCKSGHEFTPETTYTKFSHGYLVRECRICRRATIKARRARLKAMGIKRLHGWHLSRKGELPICRNCGSNDRVELHHAIPRSKCRASRSDLRNGIPLCFRCHRGWHNGTVTIYRDVFRPDEWVYISTIELTGESIGAWLDNKYPRRLKAAA